MSKILKNEKIHRCIVAVILFFFIVVVLRAYEDEQFQEDSENLAVGPIYAVTEGIDLKTVPYGLGKLTFDDYPNDYVYNNVVENDVSFEDSYKYEPYCSQIGLQGLIYQFSAKVLSRFLDFETIYQGLRLCCLTLFVAIICLIVVQLIKRYGLLFALTFGVVTLMSTWPQNFASNLYWVEFTWFVPLLLGLLMLNYPKKKMIWYLLLYVSVLIKCMCGYEYLSTILMSAVLFMMVEWIVYKEMRKKLFKMIIAVGIISIVAFFTVYLLHAYIYGCGDISEGLKQMQVDLVGRRTYGDAQDYSISYADSLNASVFVVFNKYIGFGNIHGVFMLLLFVATIITLAYRKYKMNYNCKMEVCLFVVSLACTLSWIILAKAHSYAHTHMNFVLFFMGWAQICYYIIVKTIIETSGIEIIRKCTSECNDKKSVFK